jgi:ABC-type lipoprotein release transport system permease subunit
MTWTYGGDPSANNRDHVRFLVGDTDTTDQLVTDEEIAFAVAQAGNAGFAAVIVARAVAASFARKSDRSVGDLSISYSQRFTQYQELAERLEREATFKSVSPYAGGISVADKEAVANNTDRVTPAMRVGVHDNPGATDTTDDD